MKTVNVLITIGIALFVAAIVLAFTQGGINSAMDSLLGSEDKDSILNCNPAESDKNCPSRKEYSTQNSANTIEARMVESKI